jgi:hypothetical protein
VDADPVEICPQRLAKTGETLSESSAWKTFVRIKEHIVKVLKALRQQTALYILGHHGDQPLAE